jgi:hypothetical protein
MRYRSVLVAWVVVMGMLAAALPAAAQATNEPLSWLINVTAKPGKYMDLEKATEKYDKPVLDKLVADGVIGSYGFAYQVVGPPDQSCMYFITAADWSAMGKIEKAFEDNHKGMKEAEVKAMMDSYFGATLAEKEVSSVVRHVVFQGTPGTKPNYLMRHVYKFKPGQGSAAVKMFKQYNAPIYQKLLEAGVINGYGLAVPEVHTGDGWTHSSWVVFSDMSQMDAIDKAFDEAMKARGEELNEMLRSTLMKMHDMDARWDSLMHISIYGSKPSK